MTSLSWPLLTGQLKGWNGILETRQTTSHISAKAAIGGSSNGWQLWQMSGSSPGDPKNPHFKFDLFSG